MTRTYNSLRRKASAQKTRDDIIAAALKLHWHGITELEPLAQEAGVSLASVRKHFPNKEEVYRNCTRAFAEKTAFPDPAKIAQIPDLSVRLSIGVDELCRLHESMMGYAWHSAHEREKSPVLGETMGQYDSLTDAIAGALTPQGASKETAGAIRGLLDHLTYRALRLSGKLSAEEAAARLRAMLGGLLAIPV